ncbi:hypothetical protein EAH86_03025 [Pedococcus bigeumensis]|uniref:Uncharacterized protein n=1 Tax=Pedococcus bigeumensis TaxID=433644 RepID=A0A502D5U4_9MICO|nr:hypothetical protein EAH86_03025 [Pedococcus bigeumensis]
MVSVLCTMVVASVAATGSAAGPAASGAAPATSSVAPTAPYTAATLASGGGGNTVLDSRVGTVTATKFQGDLIQLGATDGDGNSYTASVSPKEGTSWVAGTRVPMTSQTSGGMEAYVNVASPTGGTCWLRGGTVSVIEVTRDGAGDITSLALDWSGTCEDANSTPTIGQFRYNSSVPYSGLTGTSALTFSYATIGRVGPAKTITMTARGSAPIEVADLMLLGSDTPWLVITAQTCKGKTLADGQTCTVTVAPAPRSDSGTVDQLVVLVGADTRWYGTHVEVSGQHHAEGTYQPITSRRALDTRSGLGGTKGVLGARRTLKFKVTGDTVPTPSRVQAVVLTLTAAGTTAATYLTAYPGDKPRPTASSLNAPRGYTGGNTVTVRPDASGYVTVYNNTGSTHVIADVLGYYNKSNDGALAVGGDYHLTMAQRIIDSRSGFGRLKPGYYVDIDWKYPESANLGELRAYALNVTATSATGPGYLTAWSGYGDPPNASTVNFAKGKTASNTVIAPAYFTQRGNDYGPGFALYNGASTAAVHFVIDIVGVYTETGHPNALRFTPLASPTRILDSRKGLGASTWAAGTTRQVFAPSPAATYDTWAVVGNATVVAPTAPTYMTFFEPGTTRPPTSNVNAGIGEVVSNGVVAPLAVGNIFNGYNNKGTANALFDAAGRLDVYPASYEVLSGAQTLAGSSPGGAALGSSLASAMAHLPRGTSLVTPEAVPAH